MAAEPEQIDIYAVEADMTDGTQIARAISRIVAGAALAIPIGACGATHTPTPTPSASIPAAAARGQSPTYTAQVFLHGMKVTVPNRQWGVFEDHPGEYNLAAPPGVMNEVHVHFWLDPFATAAHGRALHGIGRTPKALVEWLGHDRDLVVSQPVRRRIAGRVTAISVDLDLSATAPREDPSCPGPCLTYLGFRGRNYGFEFGSGRQMPVRLYFASVRRGGKTRILAVAIDTPSARAFNAALAPVETMLASVRLPARLSPGHGPGVGTADR